MRESVRVPDLHLFNSCIGLLQFYVLLASLDFELWDGGRRDLVRGANLCQPLLIGLECVLVHLPLFDVFEAVVEEQSVAVVGIGPETLITG